MGTTVQESGLSRKEFLAVSATKMLAGAYWHHLDLPR